MYDASSQHDHTDPTYGYVKPPHDINEAHLTGVVEHFRNVTTRTGTPMIMGRVRCWKESVNVVAFNELAESVLPEIGERVEVFGKIQSTRYQTQDGAWRYGYQVVATEIKPLQPTEPAASFFARQEKKETRKKSTRTRRTTRTQGERPGVMVVGENENLPF